MRSCELAERTGISKRNPQARTPPIGLDITLLLGSPKATPQPRDLRVRISAQRRPKVDRPSFDDRKRGKERAVVLHLKRNRRGQVQKPKAVQRDPHSRRTLPIRVLAACAAHRRAWRGSGIEQEVQHVTILDRIGLAFRAHLAGFLRRTLAAEGDVVIIGDGFGADEAFFKIPVDHTGGLGR